MPTWLIVSTPPLILTVMALNYMTKSLETSVSIIGSAYFQPISDLIDRWFSTPRPKSNKVQSGYYENGYATSVALLLIAMFESYVVRVRYINKKSVPHKLKTAIGVLSHVYSDIKNIKALTDVYVLRDAVFHNHLWEIEYTWGGSPGMVMKDAEKHPAFGDGKFLDRVNLKTRKTKALGLSIVPTRINRVDARKVFETIWKTLIFLEQKNRNQCYVSHIHVNFRGKSILFSDLINEFYKSP